VTPSTSVPNRQAAAHGEDILCFSHLRWNFVFQRPQHLLTRAARERRVFFFEEPLYDSSVPRVESRRDPSGVVVAVPHLPPGTTPDAAARLQRTLLDRFLTAHRIGLFLAWYYTPMALAFSDHLHPVATLYDCMDELSGFTGAPPGLREAEASLLARAHLVLTGGHSLYEAKRRFHHNVHACPSSVDAQHFRRARADRESAPPDQAHIPSPRLGFFGVIDERLDRDLLAQVSMARPDWHFVLIGPVVKIDPGSLPRGANLHYLGQKTYAELPDYIAGWDVALLPFARNDATRFISPTKTPEYLAAGRPVVSTSITDVVRPYGELGLARIADTPSAFVQAVEQALADDRAALQRTADQFLAGTSWDATWSRVRTLLARAVASAQQDAASAASIDRADDGTISLTA
jgi:glycosyltransferase involved in cell wall biosynthesis